MNSKKFTCTGNDIIGSGKIIVTMGGRICMSPLLLSFEFISDDGERKIAFNVHSHLVRDLAAWIVQNS